MLVTAVAPTGHAVISGESIQVTGYVKDNEGAPVAGIDVAGDDYVGDVYPANTDANGYYAIAVTAEGNYRVTVNCDQLAARGYGCASPGAVTLTSGSAQLDFTVIPAAPPLLITNIFLPEGAVGVVYRTQLGAKGGRGPYQWQFSLDSTNPPVGLVLNSRGLLSGRPMTNGVSVIKVQVTDANSTVTNKVFSMIFKPRPLADTAEAPLPK